MNCEAALGSRTPFASPYGEQRDGITLVWIPWLGGTRQGACLRCLHQGFGLRHLIEVLDLCKLLLLCHQEHENTRLVSAAPPFSLPSTLSFSMSVYHTPNQNPAQSNGLKDPVYQWTNYTGFQYLLELQSTGTGHFLFVWPVRHTCSGRQLPANESSQ